MANTFHEGYAAALREVAQKMADGGFAAACQWIEDNAGDDETYATAKRFRLTADLMDMGDDT